MKNLLWMSNFSLPPTRGELGGILKNIHPWLENYIKKTWSAIKENKNKMNRTRDICCKNTWCLLQEHVLLVTRTCVVYYKNTCCLLQEHMLLLQEHLLFVTRAHVVCYKNTCSVYKCYQIKPSVSLRTA